MAKQTKTPSTQAPVYTLNPAALALAAQGSNGNPTLQAPSKGLGKGWRAPNYRAPNTRAAACAAIQAACGATFTALQAQGALAAARTAGTLNLGTGTPASYCKAFVKNGYFAPSA